MQASDTDRYGFSPASTGRERTPFQIGCRVLAVGALAGALIVAFVLFAIAPLTEGERRTRRIVTGDLVLQRQITQLRGSMSGWTSFLEPQLDAIRVPGASPVPAEIAKGSQLAQAQIDEAKVLGKGLRSYGLRSEADTLDAAMSAYTASFTELTPVAAGEDVTPSEFTRIVNAEQRRVHARLGRHDIDRPAGPQRPHHSRRAVRHPQVRRRPHDHVPLRTRRPVLLVDRGGGLRPASGTSRTDTRREVAHRNEYGSDLQQALELSRTEAAVYGVVGRAMRESVPELSVEMLIADSSRAHFSRVLASSPDPEHVDGCGVVSPNDCPATTRGHTMVFPSSDTLSACPYLQDRASGPCSAVCVPVSMAGLAVGVMHATGPNHSPPPRGDLDNLEFSARRAAERLALLRTFKRSETQAHTDPLTGLLNRRSLENEVRDLRSDGISYALAYGDLDYFKELNDTYGHEAGDQALRLFARVMRDSVRPADLVSRYGGEEFVIVLPDCGANTATAVLERVREQLALALTSGRVPAFTVSFGLATSNDGATYDEIVDIADHALLDAKAAGRNRVVVAS